MDSVIFVFSPLNPKPLDSIMHLDRSGTKSPEELTSIGIELEEEAQDDDRGYGVSRVSRVNRVGRWDQPITFLDIHECDTFTVSVF